MRANDQAQRRLAAMAGVEVPERWLNNIAPPREIVNHSPAHDLEAAVMHEVNEVIQAHPKVLWAVRINSGGAEFESFNAANKRVKFWYWVKKPDRENYLLGDFHIVLRDARYGIIEAKKRSWKMLPSDERARRQGNLIEICKAAGGFGGFACCAEDAKKILDAA